MSGKGKNRKQLSLFHKQQNPMSHKRDIGVVLSRFNLVY